MCSRPVCLAGRRGRAADIELCVKRMDEGPSAAPATANVPAARKSFYRLLAGTTHSNELLLHESLVAEQFPSPLTFRCTVHLPSGTPEPGRAYWSLLLLVSGAAVLEWKLGGSSVVRFKHVSA